VCNDCFKVIDAAWPNTAIKIKLEAGASNVEFVLPPPINAIANGHWTGYLPREFMGLSRTEEQACALIILNIFLSTSVISENKVVNSHIYLIKNPQPLLRYFADELTGTILHTMVGAHVSLQQALIRIRFPMRVDDSRRFLGFLDRSSITYMATEHRLTQGLDEAMDYENLIVDRTDESDNKVSKKLVRLMQFGITSYNHGTADSDDSDDPLAPLCPPCATQTSSSAGTTMDVDRGTNNFPHGDDESDEEDEDPDDENTRMHMLFQPIIPVRDMMPSTEDDAVAARQRVPVNVLIAFNSSTMPKTRGLGSFAYAFPTRFPYGSGSFDEAREVRMTETQWLVRSLRLHGEKGNRNSQHYGMLASGFDMVAMTKAFRSQYVSMRVKQDAISNFGLWNKEDIRECIKYSEDVEERARRGQSAHDPPQKVKALLKMIDMVRPGMSAMYGSDASRNSARNIAFAYTKRMGNPHVFFTQSPDPYGNYIITINTSNMRDPKHVDITIKMDEILPSRRWRKKFSNSDPFLCAVYAKQVNDVFIEWFLGWSIELCGPKKEGGALGLLEWLHIVSSTSLLITLSAANDLHRYGYAGCRNTNGWYTTFPWYCRHCWTTQDHCGHDRSSTGSCVRRQIHGIH